MKALLFCTCVLIFASFSSANIKQQLKTAISSLREDIGVCITQNNLVKDDWYYEEQILTNLHAQSGNEQRTRRCGCTIACVLKRQNMMEGSNIKELRVHDLINNAFGDRDKSEIRQLHKIVHKCIKEVKNITEECEKSFSLYICIAKAVHIAEGHEEHKPEEEEEENEPEN